MFGRVRQVRTRSPTRSDSQSVVFGLQLEHVLPYGISPATVTSMTSRPSTAAAARVGR